MGRLIRASLLPGSILTGVPVLALPIEHGGRHFDVLLDMGGPRPGRVRVVAAGAKWPRRTLPEAEGLWRKATLDIQPLRGAKAPAAARALLAAAEGALRANDVSDAQAHLDRAPAEFRHWEWRYLHSRPERSRVLGHHRQEVCGLAVHPRGDRLATASTGGTVCVWSVATGARLRQFDAGQTLRALAWSEDGASLVVASGATLSLWDGSTAQPLARYRVTDPVCALAVRACSIS